MNVLREVIEELWSMFVGDRRLTLLVIAVVALAAAAARLAGASWLAGAVLVVGALAVLADSVLQQARRKP